MKSDQFAYLSNLLRQQSGLVLTPDKAYLVESRLSPVARKWGFSDLDALVLALRSRRDQALEHEVIDAMMTNESFFFRDIKPFDQFRTAVMPQLMPARANAKTLRIWSAACSTGQEPYSLAMLLKEEGEKLAGWKFEIVATDLSRDALGRAQQGVYTQFEVQRGLPIKLLVKYFQQDQDKWRISPALRSMVSFRHFNLLGDLTPLGKFDVVFCRNVLIYFDPPTKTAVLDRISRLMPGDGVLYLGGAETVIGVSDKFAPMPGQRGIYGLTGATGATTAGTWPVARQAIA